MSAAIAQVVEKVNDEVLPFHFYSEDEWDSLTRSDTYYDNVPSGMIYIYEESEDTGGGGGSSEFDELSAVIDLPSDSAYDEETGVLTLGRSFILDENDILTEIS